MTFMRPPLAPRNGEMSTAASLFRPVPLISSYGIWYLTLSSPNVRYSFRETSSLSKVTVRQNLPSSVFVNSDFAPSFAAEERYFTLSLS